MTRNCPQNDGVGSLTLPAGTLQLDRPRLMGVVSTLDAPLERQLKVADALIADGADLIDVGGASVAVLALVEQLRRSNPAMPISVDAHDPVLARRALEAGASLINDPLGGRDVAAIVGEHRAGLVVGFVRERIDQAIASGVAPSSIVVDAGTAGPGRALDAVLALGHPVLLGRHVDADPEPLPRLLAAVAAVGVRPGVIHRVDDVRAVRDFLAVFAVLEGYDDISVDLELPVELRRARSETEVIRDA